MSVERELCAAVGFRIARRRERLGWSQEEAARRLVAETLEALAGWLRIEPQNAAGDAG